MPIQLCLNNAFVQNFSCRDGMLLLAVFLFHFDVQGSKSKSVNSMENNKPFWSLQFVSLNSSSEFKRVQILIDIGTAKTLLLENALPLSEQNFTDGFFSLQSVELGVVDDSLNRSYLKSDLIIRPVIVDVRPTLPI